MVEASTEDEAARPRRGDLRRRARPRWADPPVPERPRPCGYDGPAMCGIVGYVGPDQALPILIEGLRRLEYRGTTPPASPSSTAASTSSSARASCRTSRRRWPPSGAPPGRVGVGHTRWATHGAPTDRNAHPHTDCTGRLAVIHNGIIENHQALRDRLEKAGHAFASDTDTECIAHLFEEHFQGAPGRRGAGDGQGAGRRLRDRRAVRRRPRADRGRQGVVARWSSGWATASRSWPPTSPRSSSGRGPSSRSTRARSSR